MLPELEREDYIYLKELMENHRAEFYTNRTSFLINSLKRYVREKMVIRLSIMGPTRIGKSEMACSVSFILTSFYNELFKMGHFKDVHNDGSFIIDKLKFKVDNVRSSQSDYIYALRDKNASNELKFGQCWLIDEDRKKIGGLGSFSEDAELKNINNISAKFCQNEIWVTPDRMITRNAIFGIKAYKKDEKRKINWGLLYKIEMNTHGTADFSFLGWVSIPLHPFEDFRRQYEEKKNSWIRREFEGNIDERLKKRHAEAEKLKNAEVFEMTDNGRFRFSKEEQMAFINNTILEKKIDNYNEREKAEILNTIRYGKKTETFK